MVRNASEIVTIVPDGTLRYANPAWQRVLGYDLEEAIGTMNVLDHLHPEDLAHVLEETEAASRGRVAFSGGVNPRCGEPRKDRVYPAGSTSSSMAAAEVALKTSTFPRSG